MTTYLIPDPGAVERLSSRINHELKETGNRVAITAMVIIQYDGNTRLRTSGTVKVRSLYALATGRMLYSRLNVSKSCSLALYCSARLSITFRI